MDHDLISLWHFDEPDGPIAWNAVPDGASLEVRGAVRCPGRFGAALQFRNPGDNAVTMAVPPLDNGTASFWLRLDAPARAGVVLSMREQIRVVMDKEKGDRLVVALLSPSPPLELKRWYHVALVFGEGGLALFLDGKMVASDPKTTSGLTRFGPLQNQFTTICGLPSTLVPCALDELAIFNRRLSSEEIRQLARGSIAMAAVRSDHPGPVEVAAQGDVDRWDPTCGLQRAIDEAYPYGGRVVIPAGRYVLRRGLRMHSRITLVGAGGQTILAAAPGFETKLARDAKNRDDSIDVADASGFAVGDEVVVSSTGGGGYNTSHAVISEVHGSTLALSNPLWFDYPLSDGAFAARWFPMLSAIYGHDIRIEDLTIEGRAGAEGSGPVDFTAAAIDLERSLACTITRVQIRNWLHDAICLGKGSWHRVTDCLARNCKGHGYHGGNRMRKCLWLNNMAIHNGQDGFFFCIGVEDNIVSNNLFAGNSGHGIGGLGNLDDVRNLVSNNQCVENGKAGIHLDGGSHNLVTNNICRSNSRSETGKWAGIHLSAPTRLAVVTGNHCLDDQTDRTQTLGVVEAADCETNVIRDNVCTNCEVKLQGRNTEAERNTVR